MPAKTMTAEAKPVLWRIGEVAKLTGVTTRTLRYWEELELLQPSSYRTSGERLYSPADVARVNRIRNLQELLGFSLAEVRTVLGTEDVDVLDRMASELKAGDLSPERHRQLLDEGIVANDQLLARLDETLGRIQAFRDERAATAVKLRERRRLLDEADEAGWRRMKRRRPCPAGRGRRRRTRPYAAPTARVGVRRRRIAPSPSCTMSAQGGPCAYPLPRPTPDVSTPKSEVGTSTVQRRVSRRRGAVVVGGVRHGAGGGATGRGLHPAGRRGHQGGGPPRTCDQDHPERRRSKRRPTTVCAGAAHPHRQLRRHRPLHAHGRRPLTTSTPARAPRTSTCRSGSGRNRTTGASPSSMRCRRCPGGPTAGSPGHPMCKRWRGDGRSTSAPSCAGVIPETHCIGSAFARSPAGPFVATAHPFICQLAHRGSIDARVFVEADGQPGHAVEVRGQRQSERARARPGRRHRDLRPGPERQRPGPARGSRSRSSRPSEPWESTIVEAPDMIEAQGTYWLFFSGNWFNSPTTGSGWRIARAPSGRARIRIPRPSSGPTSRASARARSRSSRTAALSTSSTTPSGPPTPVRSSPGRWRWLASASPRSARISPRSRHLDSFSRRRGGQRRLSGSLGLSRGAWARR